MGHRSTPKPEHCMALAVGYADQLCQNHRFDGRVRVPARATRLLVYRLVSVTRISPRNSGGLLLRVIETATRLQDALDAIVRVEH